MARLKERGGLGTSTLHPLGLGQFLVEASHGVYVVGVGGFSDAEESKRWMRGTLLTNSCWAVFEPVEEEELSVSKHTTHPLIGWPVIAVSPCGV